MRGYDYAILAVFALICALLYLGGTLAVRVNRRNWRHVLFGGGAVLLGVAAIWYTVFASPLAQNWGLGGSYLWMSLCPVLFALVGIAVTAINTRKKEN